MRPHSGSVELPLLKAIIKCTLECSKLTYQTGTTCTRSSHEVFPTTMTPTPRAQKLLTRITNSDASLPSLSALRKLGKP